MKSKMYKTRAGDLEKTMERAREESVDFVIHEDDLCNDYLHSPEITDVYLKLGLSVFGVYGNHELERAGNTMQIVTRYLTNEPENVFFGTKDGKIGDGSIACYYFGEDDFFAEPLCAAVTISSDGEIDIRGSKTEWLYGIKNPTDSNGAAPEISEL